MVSVLPKAEPSREKQRRGVFLLLLFSVRALGLPGGPLPDASPPLILLNVDPTFLMMGLELGC